MGCCVLASTGEFCQQIFAYNIESHVYTRLRDDPKLVEATTKRYVITAPPGHFQLLPSDQVRQEGRWGRGECIANKIHTFFKVYVLLQFDPGTEYTPHWMDKGERKEIFLHIMFTWSRFEAARAAHHRH